MKYKRYKKVLHKIKKVYIIEPKKIINKSYKRSKWIAKITKNTFGDYNKIKN